VERKQREEKSEKSTRSVLRLLANGSDESEEQTYLVETMKNYRSTEKRKLFREEPEMMGKGREDGTSALIAFRCNDIDALDDQAHLTKSSE